MYEFKLPNCTCHALVTMSNLPLPIKVDGRHLPYLCSQEKTGSRHSPPKWFWDNRLGHLYTTNKANLRVYLVDIVNGFRSAERAIMNRLPNLEKDEFIDCTSSNIQWNPLPEYLIDGTKIVAEHSYTLFDHGQWKGLRKNIIYQTLTKSGKTRYYMHCDIDKDVKDRDVPIYTRISKNSIPRIQEERSGFKVAWQCDSKQRIYCMYWEQQEKRTRKVMFLNEMLLGTYITDRNSEKVEYKNGNIYDNRMSNLSIIKKKLVKKKKKVQPKNDSQKEISSEAERMKDRNYRQREKNKKNQKRLATYHSLTAQMEENGPIYIKGCKVIKSYPGTVQKMGTNANIEKNRIYKTRDPDKNIKYYMYIEPGDYTLIDRQELENIQYHANGDPRTWYLKQNGYAACTLPCSETLYLHQCVMLHRGYGRGQNSVDHINRDKLDNRVENLRIVSQSEQNRNQGKKDRQYCAQTLPDNLTQADLPKYVVYYTDKEGSLGFRDWFKIEKHPTLLKNNKPPINSSKVMQKGITIRDKLKEVKKYLEYLDQGELPPDKSPYPQFVYLGNDRGKWALIFDPHTKPRKTLCMRIKKQDIAGTYQLFQEKVMDKFGIAIDPLKFDPEYPDEDPPARTKN